MINIKHYVSLLKRIFLLASSFLLLAILFTWPLAKNITTHGFGINEDSPYHIWHNWWFKYSVFDLHQSPFYTNYIFYPQTVPLTFDANAFVFSAMTLPLQPIIGVVGASNIIFLLSFALSGMGIFLLARRIFGLSNFSSFLAGVIYAFSPYTFSQAIDGHINITSTWIIPFLTFFVILAIKKAKENEKFILSKEALIAGIFLGLQAYSDLTYTAFTILLLGLIFVFYAFISRKEKKEILKITVPFLIAGIISLLIFLPGLIPTLSDFRKGINPSSPLWVQNVWSADLVAFFKPSTNSALFKNLAFAPHQGSIEGTVFLGWTTIVLAIFFIYKFIRNWKKLDLKERRMKSLLIFLSVSFFVLSLGPFLNIANRNTSIPLPFVLIHKIPLIGGTQETARMNPFFMLSLSIIAGLGLDLLIEKSKSKWRKILIGAIPTILIVLEFMQIPFPTTDLRPPKVYDVIAKDKGEKAVLDLPLGFNSGNMSLGHSPIGSLQFYQTYHKHPQFRGTIARVPIENFDYYTKIPLFKYFLNPGTLPDGEDLDQTLANSAIRKKLNVGYIIIHKDILKEKGINIGQSEALIKDLLKAEKYFEDENAVGYKLN